MDNNEMTEALQMKVRRNIRIARIKQVGLAVGSVFVAATASVLLVNEIQKNN